MRSFIAFLIMSCAAACVTEDNGVPYVPSPPPTDIQTLRVWIEENSPVSPEIALESCMIWRWEGIQCVLTSDLLHAHVRIRMANAVTLCKPQNGLTTLAESSPGQIDMFTACIRQKSDFSRTSLLSIIGHEFGHQLGLRHVATADACQSSDGTVCGGALMNPIIHGITQETEIDHEAYLQRGPSVLDSEPGEETTSTTSSRASAHHVCGVENGSPEHTDPGALIR